MGTVRVWPILLWIAFVAASRLCEKNGDTYGSWVPSSSVDVKHLHHFVHGNAQAALEFDMTWLPHNCTYHRFTAQSIHAAVAHLVANKTQPQLRITFMGDSALRGIMCGIGRILLGSELHGPNSNVVCGSPQNRKIVSFPDLHARYGIQYGPHLLFSFIYIEFLHNVVTGTVLQKMMDEHPYALVLNTGAWDFMAVKELREQQGINSTDLCDTPTDVSISEQRVSEPVQKVLATAGNLAKSNNVRAIYRTNHHNSRFGTKCADDKLLPILNATGWEVWDNTRISEDVWRTQNTDGFHFDRSNAHSVADHESYVNAAKTNQKQSPGMLEIQLAQSLLFFLFCDAISELHHVGQEST